MTTAASKDFQSEVGALAETFMAAYNRADANGLAELYTEDALLLPPGSDLLRGHDAIRGFWQGAMDAGIKEISLEPIEAESLGDGAVEIGKFTLSGSDGSELDNGKYIVVWKHTGSGWKLHRDIFNSSRPAA